MAYDVELLPSAAAFWSAAAEHLATRPVASTVVTTVAQRALRHGDPAPAAGVPYWYAVVRDGTGTVVGAAMRTATEPPYVPYLLDMPDAAARALARAVRARGEDVAGVNGVAPGAVAFAAAFGEPEVAQRTRLWELGELVAPEDVPGRLRPAGPGAADVARAVAWFAVFADEAAAQAGHDRMPVGTVEETGMRERIADGGVHFWEVDGEPVHVTGASPPAHGVARIGPVYTPPEHRGHGYAAAAVAEVARRLGDAGARVCLFTDVDNPVSNRLYARLGFVPVTDMLRLAVG